MSYQVLVPDNVDQTAIDILEKTDGFTITAPGGMTREETLAHIAGQDYLLAVATGKGRNGLDKALHATGFGQWFHASRCADETCSKPHPQMLEELLGELGVKPENALMVGDTEYDLRMASDAGMASVAVSYGVHSIERLLECGPQTCIHAFSELTPWLDSVRNS